MHMHELRGRLQDMGVDQPDLVGLLRWDLVHLIRTLATEAAKSGIGDAMHR